MNTVNPSCVQGAEYRELKQALRNARGSGGSLTAEWYSVSVTLKEVAAMNILSSSNTATQFIQKCGFEATASVERDHTRGQIKIGNRSRLEDAAS